MLLWPNRKEDKKTQTERKPKTFPSLREGPCFLRLHLQIILTIWIVIILNMLRNEPNKVSGPREDEIAFRIVILDDGTLYI
jgi:hypothetical protein